MEFPQPIVVLSKCLELEACRYNAMSIRSVVVRALLPHVDVRPICPEVEIGLGVPRQPIRLIARGKSLRLVQPSSDRDLTAAMTDFSNEFLGGLGDVDGFILKSRSPSCGIKDTKVHAGGDTPNPMGKGPGMFGGAVLERFPDAAVEDEGRLTNFRLRHHFLTKLFLRARFRAVRARRSMAALVGFHASNKFLLMAYHQSAMRALGRIVANAERRHVSEVLDRYAAELARALQRPARRPANVNVLMHALGYFSDGLSAREKAHFLDVLAEYRAERATLEIPLTVIHQWLARFGEDYIAQQSFLEPYPRDLLSLGDSGK